jgi:serine protease inhibitor ecotin
MPEYQDGMTQIATSLQIYQRMEQIAPLTKAESSFRKSVIETKKLIEEMAEKLVKSASDDNTNTAPSD